MHSTTSKILLIIPLITASYFASAVTLEDYLGEVKLKNGGIRGTEKSYQSKALRTNEAALYFKPSFFLNGEYFDDQRPTNAPVFQGTQTLRHTIRAGLNQNLRTGTKATLSYNYFKTQINGVNGTLLPNRQFFDVAPQIEISQSLWRNFLGSEFEASETAQRAQVEVARYSDEFLHKQLMIAAENAYWRLYFAQRSLSVQKESLERAKKLREWNSQRMRNNLGEESDLLQAEANLQSREIDYQDTLTEIDTALREYNSIRETEGVVNLENAEAKDSSYILNATVPPKAKVREDVLAFMATQNLAKANSQLGTERNKPNLELYGSYAMYGRDKQYSDAYDQAMTATRPYSIFGVRFTTPLDFGSLSDYKKAYAQEVVAAEMNFKRKAYEVEREWEILNQRFTNFKSRLKLSRKMEQIQDKKLTTEKKRFNQGRTTTFQVLQFEQDFANAQLLKLRNERDLITVYNQLKLFSGVDHE